ncbi:MAG: flagellar type III secretion system pore protein FliP [Eubacteriales bacterium]|jgi:flagellar biosynthetic protein FliP|nr:flagellar type III secretion system pore protein FliP [Eubacteriales bacterium]
MKKVSEINRGKVLLFITAAFVVVLASSVMVFAEPNDQILPNVNIQIGAGEGAEPAQGIQIIFLLTILTLAPSILIMMTGFTRIVIVLSFVRNALGIQQLPPNQVLIGLALFLTFFVMTPVFSEINDVAYQPLVRNEITQQQAVENAMKPLRTFMLKQTHNKDLSLFMSLAGEAQPENVDEIKSSVIIPAFIISELKRAFQIGFFIFIPFIVIDMVVSSTLMTMGMMMLPPMMISLPFKILLFIMVDGWNLVIKTLVTGFN